MAKLTASKAVDRLERRGGQVIVFRRGYGAQVVFDCIDREDGHAVVVGKSQPLSPKRYGPRRFVLTGSADRERLGREMDGSLEAANTGLEGVEHPYELVHRDILSTDAGYAQVGCFVAVLSVLVGLLVGLAGAWIATGGISGDAAIVGAIVGFVIGFMGVDPVLSIAVERPAFRDRITDLAIAWWVVMPAVVTAATIIGIALATRPG